MHLSKRPARLLLRDSFVVLAILVTSIALYILILKFFLVITNTKVAHIQGYVGPDLFFINQCWLYPACLTKWQMFILDDTAAYGSKAHIFAVLIFLAAPVLYTVRIVSPDSGAPFLAD